VCIKLLSCELCAFFVSKKPKQTVCSSHVLLSYCDLTNRSCHLFDCTLMSEEAYMRVSYFAIQYQRCFSRFIAVISPINPLRPAYLRSNNSFHKLFAHSQPFTVLQLHLCYVHSPSPADSSVGHSIGAPNS